MKPSETIREAKRLIIEQGWHQGTPRDDAETLCLENALCKASGLSSNQFGFYAREAVGPAAAHVQHAVGAVVLWGWNDTTGRTIHDVLDALDKAEKHAEIQESLCSE